MNLLGRCLEEGWAAIRTALPRRVVSALGRDGYFRGEFNYASALAQRGQAAAAATWYLKGRPTAATVPSAARSSPP